MDKQKEIKTGVKVSIDKIDKEGETIKKLPKNKRVKSTKSSEVKTDEPIKETIKEDKPVIEIAETVEEQHESWFVKIYKAIVDFFKKIF